MGLHGTGDDGSSMGLHGTGDDGSSMGLHGTGDDGSSMGLHGSIVDCSWRRFLRKCRPSTSTSYDRRPRGRVQWPKLHFFSPGNFMRMASPAFKGARFLMPLLYCLHCNLFLAARLLVVVLMSQFGLRSTSAVGSKVRVRRPISL